MTFRPVKRAREALDSRKSQFRLVRKAGAGQSCSRSVTAGRNPRGRQSVRHPAFLKIASVPPIKSDATSRNDRILCFRQKMILGRFLFPFLVALDADRDTVDEQNGVCSAQDAFVHGPARITRNPPADQFRLDSIGSSLAALILSVYVPPNARQPSLVLPW